MSKLPHIPLFHLLKNGVLTVSIAYDDKGMSFQPLWILYETSKDVIKFRLFTNSLQGVTPANISTGIPPYLNVHSEGKVRIFFFNKPQPNDNISTITYSPRDADELTHDNNLTMNPRNDYILFISGQQNKKLEKIGVYINRNDGLSSKAYVWESRMQYASQDKIELDLTEFERNEDTVLHPCYPPILLTIKNILHVFMVKDIDGIDDNGKMIYKEINIKEISSKRIRDKEEKECSEGLLMLNPKKRKTF